MRAPAAFAVLLVFASPGCASQVTDVRAGGAAAFSVVPIGLCEDYPEESRSVEEVRADIETLKQAGVAVLRVSIGWDGVEPERDRYDFAFWDTFVAETHAAGIRVIPYVAYTPRWNSAGESDHWRRPPRDVGEFGQVMGLLAGRYRGRIDSWEIWNEPDNADFWTGTAADYARLLKAGAGAVRSAAPNARVVFGGVAGRPEFAAEVLADPAIGSLVDIVNAHAYFETWNPNPIETLPAYVAAFARVKPRPLWLAEVGYSDFRGNSRASSGPRSPSCDPHCPRCEHCELFEHTPAFQAVALIRNLTLALTRPEVALFAWYEIKDPAADAPVIGDDNNRHLGVLFSDRRPKPALAALTFANRLFGAGFIRLDDRLRVSKPVTSKLEVHAFLTAAEHVAIVSWLPTAASVEGERVTVELPVRPIGAVRRFDAEGHETARLPSAVDHERRLRFEDVRIDRGEVAVFEIAVEPFTHTSRLAGGATVRTVFLP
jgi:polysaccharide biosynthesis protein PslG